MGQYGTSIERDSKGRERTKNKYGTKIERPKMEAAYCNTSPDVMSINRNCKCGARPYHTHQQEDHNISI